MENTRTMAFQISEELFQRIKEYLARESTRSGKKLTQREFILGLIEDALDRAEHEEMQWDGNGPTINDNCIRCLYEGAAYSNSLTWIVVGGAFLRFTQT